MRYEDDTEKLPRGFAVIEVLLLIAFTVLDIFQWVPTVSDSLKLLSVLLCFIFSISLLFSINAETDRILLLFSLAFTLIAGVFLLFVEHYFYAALACCIVQEFHAVRIFSMKKALVRIDGRIDALYRNYKVRSRMFLMNLFLLVLAGIPAILSLFITVPRLPLVCAIVFYSGCLLCNSFRLLWISRDIRLLDDMRPLHAYFAGMLLNLIGCVYLLVLIVPKYFQFSLWPEEFAHISSLVIQAIYLAGIVCITFSGCRKQEFYT